MNKQIEEMAHLVCEMAYKPNSCQECAGRKGGCFTLPKMKILHDHGYRKQSEGEWILTVNEYREKHPDCEYCLHRARPFDKCIALNKRMGKRTAKNALAMFPENGIIKKKGGAE